MDSLMWKSWILFLLLVEETLTQDQPPSVKNPDDNKDNMIIAIITTFGVIAVISVVAMIIYFCQRRERYTHGIDNVSSHCQTSED